MQQMFIIGYGQERKGEVTGMNNLLFRWSALQVQNLQKQGNRFFQLLAQQLLQVSETLVDHFLCTEVEGADLAAGNLGM